MASEERAGVAGEMSAGKVSMRARTTAAHSATTNGPSEGPLSPARRLRPLRWKAWSGLRDAPGTWGARGTASGLLRKVLADAGRTRAVYGQYTAALRRGRAAGAAAAMRWAVAAAGVGHSQSDPQ